MRHPNPSQLALLAGGDLKFWDRWRFDRHVAACPACSKEIQALRIARDQVRGVAAELPENLNWNQLAQEMTANIRVGLEAGEAIARFDKPALTGRRRLGWNAAMVVACATVVFCAAFWINLPQQQMDHLLSALRGVRVGRIGALVQHPAAEDMLLEASSFSLDLSKNGRTLSLMHPRSDSVTVSVSMRGSVGVRYVDADTGQVTTNKVYDAEQ
jgi:anti-sigma factor RsiW